MHTSIRAARQQVAMETIIAEADIVGDRFSIPFDAEAMARGNRDPFVAMLLRLEAVADFMTALRTSTDPPAAMPNESERLAAMTTDEVKTLVDAIELPDDLDAIEAAEAGGKNRITVMKAIQSKKEHLSMVAPPQDRPDDDLPETPADDEDVNDDASTADDDRARIEGVDDPESRDSGDGAGMERTESEPR
jgi:hypothetical protein